MGAGWTCERCGRLFARTGQGHDCAPAMTLDEYFATDPGHERPVFDAVMDMLDGVGPVHVEPVSVGIFLKNPRRFAQLRTMRQWVALSFSLPREVRHPRISRKVIPHGGRYHHVLNIRGPEDLDEDVRGWLIEAYTDA